MMEQAKEEQAVILDFLPNGYPFDPRPSHKKPPIAQAIGKNHLVLLELVPKREIHLQPLEEVYIGEGKRDKVHHISGRLFYDKLTNTARTELEEFINKVVQENEARFVAFFNGSQSLSTRMHQLELLPGLGKKHMWEILEEREKKPFENFKDIESRIKLLQNPKKLIIKRILLEIEGKEKHNIFVGR